MSLDYSRAAVEMKLIAAVTQRDTFRSVLAAIGAEKGCDCRCMFEVCTRLERSFERDAFDNARYHPFVGAHTFGAASDGSAECLTVPMGRSNGTSATIALYVTRSDSALLRSWAAYQALIWATRDKRRKIVRALRARHLADMRGEATNA